MTRVFVVVVYVCAKTERLFTYEMRIMSHSGVNGLNGVIITMRGMLKKAKISFKEST